VTAVAKRRPASVISCGAGIISIPLCILAGYWQRIRNIRCKREEERSYLFMLVAYFWQTEC